MPNRAARGLIQFAIRCPVQIPQYDQGFLNLPNLGWRQSRLERVFLNLRSWCACFRQAKALPIGNFGVPSQQLNHAQLDQIAHRLRVTFNLRDGEVQIDG
ncbi:hypothetical protein ACMU_05680 [Actibacterium mucosum KCTC 23349]|uniref:Uncharacterized protein n=1 Tax=Actibacterium mucosum KCTC 23349 TaxID=1454373 RepID=A0A037ZK24_9RHOB|nr:hypothetical protein ACMU_05680 [Actibacterium mucosum KCTC 23349]